MRKKLSIIYKLIFIHFLLLLFIQCKEEENTEIIKVDELLPSSEGNYEYNEVDSIPDEESNDIFLDSLNAVFNEDIIELKELSHQDKWRYPPDRLSSDTSITRLLLVGKNEFVYKSWKYKDSLLSINAFYNWLDCFGPSCKSVALQDSVKVSNKPFLIVQNNESIHFIKGSRPFDKQLWLKFLGFSSKEDWNYIIEQPAHGMIRWM